MRRKHEDFHDGAKDGLTPLEPLDITSVQDFDELLAAMGKTAFGGRSLGEAAEVLTQMVRDPECAVVGTFSGAMSVAKMGLMICEMIDRGWLQVIITTGALIAHGFIETLGRVHYKYPEQVSDRQLYQQGYNRIYDTLEMEANLDYAEDVFRTVLEGLDSGETWSSASLCRELGKYLAEHTDSPGILRSAYLKGVPVFIPAFTDSELGLDLAGFMVRRALAEGKDIAAALGSVSLKFNPFLDLGAYAQKALADPETGNLYRGRRRPPELGPAGGALPGFAANPPEPGSTGSAVSLRRAALPGAGPLGGLERLHLQGGGLLGQVCLFRRMAAVTPRSCATPPSPGLSSSRASASVWTKRQRLNRNPARSLRTDRNPGPPCRRRPP